MADICLGKADRKDEYGAVQCIFCASGREQAVAGELNRLDGLTAIAATKLKKEWRKGAWQLVQKAMLPGYVFLYMHNTILTPAERAVLQPLRILKYNDGSSLLIGRDRRFADWLWSQGGTVGISKAMRRGDRVEITGGPLAELGGEITKVDGRKQIAKVTIGIERGLNIWLSFEYVEVTGAADNRMRRDGTAGTGSLSGIHLRNL